MSIGYITLARQSGLMGEMRAIANNIANASTTGFRREEVIFSEFVNATSGGSSVSLGAARARQIDLSQGDLQPTGGAFDLAIQGEGFFVLETAEGERLTRGGAFLPNDAGDLVTPDGHRVLDEGGSPIFIPPDSMDISVAADGTISADGRPVARVGIVSPEDGLGLSRTSGAQFTSQGDLRPVDAPRVLQGYVESSNVEPIQEIARMIEVQRAYELAQSFTEKESERMSKLIDTITK